MPNVLRKRLLQTSALIVGYAMSRLDTAFLKARKWRTWNDAFQDAGELLRIAPASLKNLRDEYDPLHGNARRGWWKRPLRADRQRVMGELCDISDAALLEMVDRILRGDRDAMQEVVRPLSKPASGTQIFNVAERLRTGGLAERYFLDNSMKIVEVEKSQLLDHRALASGYDFGVKERPRIAIEVKGLKQKRGGITFTDREWSEAIARSSDFWLVIIGNLEVSPLARVVRDPTSVLSAKCRYQTTIAASWQATVTVA